MLLLFWLTDELKTQELDGRFVGRSIGFLSVWTIVVWPHGKSDICTLMNGADGRVIVK
jgi:hypothetical protein